MTEIKHGLQPPVPVIIIGGSVGGGGDGSLPLNAATEGKQDDTINVLQTLDISLAALNTLLGTIETSTTELEGIGTSQLNIIGNIYSNTSTISSIIGNITDIPAIANDSNVSLIALTKRLLSLVEAINSIGGGTGEFTTLETINENQLVVLNDIYANTSSIITALNNIITATTSTSSGIGSINDPPAIANDSDASLIALTKRLLSLTEAINVSNSTALLDSVDGLEIIGTNQLTTLGNVADSPAIANDSNVSLIALIKRLLSLTEANSGGGDGSLPLDASTETKQDLLNTLIGSIDSTQPEFDEDPSNLNGLLRKIIYHLTDVEAKLWNVNGSIGEVSDAVAPDDTYTTGLNGLLKRALTHLSTIIGHSITTDTNSTTIISELNALEVQNAELIALLSSTDVYQGLFFSLFNAIGYKEDPAATTDTDITVGINGLIKRSLEHLTATLVKLESIEMVSFNNRDYLDYIKGESIQHGFKFDYISSMLEADLIDNSTKYIEDSVHTTGSRGNFILGVRNDTAANVTNANGDYSPLSVDSAGRLLISGEISAAGGASELHLGSIGGSLNLSIANLIRPSDATPYAVRDTVSNSITVPTVLTFPNTTRITQGSGYLTKALLFTSQITNVTRFRLHLYSIAPTAINDNTVLNILWVNRDNYIGFIDFPAMQTGGTDSAFSINDTIRIPYVTVPGSNSIYGMLETLEIFTPASAQSFSIQLMSDNN